MSKFFKQERITKLLHNMVALPSIGCIDKDLSVFTLSPVLELDSTGQRLMIEQLVSQANSEGFSPKFMDDVRSGNCVISHHKDGVVILSHIQNKKEVCSTLLRYCQGNRRVAWRISRLFNSYTLLHAFNMLNELFCNASGEQLVIVCQKNINSYYMGGKVSFKEDDTVEISLQVFLSLQEIMDADFQRHIFFHQEQSYISVDLSLRTTMESMETNASDSLDILKLTMDCNGIFDWEKTEAKQHQHQHQQQEGPP